MSGAPGLASYVFWNPSNFQSGSAPAGAVVNQFGNVFVVGTRMGAILCREEVPSLGKRAIETVDARTVLHRHLFAAGR